MPKVLMHALVTDAAYLDAFITAEEAAKEDHAELDSDIAENGSSDETIDDEWTHGESVGSGRYLIQDLVN